MMDGVATALARLGQRDHDTTDRDLVFCDQLGRHLGYKTLRARYKKALKTAKLRDLRFHDLRHTFGTHAIRAADPREVMEWMGHADIQTTQKYLAYKPRRDAAKRLRRRLRRHTGRDCRRRLAVSRPRRAPLVDHPRLEVGAQEPHVPPDLQVRHPASPHRLVDPARPNREQRRRCLLIEQRLG
jgi:hypothetical protein